MVKIFISYRRADSRKDAGRIYDRLIDPFGKANVFKDVDSIPLGKDVRGVLREAVAQCDVLLAVMGKQWLNIKNEDGGRRLDNPDDFVRIEIESGLQRDSCLVIPVLVDNAPMPQADELPMTLRELAFKNATHVRDDPDFHKDVDHIINALNNEFDVMPQATTIRRKVQASTYDVRRAIADFYRAFDEKQWEEARQILAEIRASGKAPRIFNVDSHEQDVWSAIESEQRDEQYDLIRMMAEHGNPERTLEALQTFWQDFPDYDPDSLATGLKPVSVSSNANDVITKARSFAGKRNSDWTPIIQTFEAQGLNFDMCLVPPGTFQMGSDDGHDDERPVHEQTIREPYWIGVHPITNDQWRHAVKRSNGIVNVPEWSGWYDDMSKAKHPVVVVTWYQVMDFVKWLGDEWWLPTELEWEYAARGVESLIYPFGNYFEADKIVYSENSGDSTAPIDQRPGGAAWVGAQDMSGNVWDWTLSVFEDYPYYPNDGREDLSSTADRVLRGGSWDHYDDPARSSYRSSDPPSNRDSDVGFRLVRPPSR